MNAKMKLLLMVVLLAFAHLRSTEAEAEGNAKSKTCLARQDLALVIDASSSICNGGNNSYVPEGPCVNWDKCIKFLIDLISTMTIGPNDIQVACIVFSTHSKVLWDFKRYQDKESLLQAIGNLTYLRGQTDTAGALRDLIHKVFGASGGVRTGVANTTIMVTDGVPTKDVEQVPILAKEAQEKGIRILVVGVGEAANHELLSSIASEPKQENVNFFFSQTYWNLSGVQDAVHNYTCEPEAIANAAAAAVAKLSKAPETCGNSMKCLAEGHCRIECLNGWRGDDCEIPPPDPCCTNPCQNGGRCMQGETWDSFVCDCPGEWNGTYCTRPVHP